ncbi:hypothetical protein B296_00052806, partial [Ensete ventricosum]
LCAACVLIFMSLPMILHPVYIHGESPLVGVYFLDGESILEIILSYISCLNRKRRQKFQQFCLVGGTILSIIFFSRILYLILVVQK